MVSNSRIVLGTLWLAFGVGLFFQTTIELWDIATRAEYGLRSGFFSQEWFIAQSMFPLFFAASAVTGAGILFGRRWSIVLLKFLSPILLIYSVAYSILGGERAWWVALLGLGGVALGIYSVRFAFFKGAFRAA